VRQEISLAVYGAGGFGREVAWMAQACTVEDKPVRPVCFIDDNDEICGTIINGLEVLTLRQAKEKYPEALVVSGIGGPKAREATMKKALAAGFEVATLIHPRVEMSTWVEIGEGTVICAGNMITTNVVIGRHVQINLHCTIGHDVVVGDYVTLAPGAHISGFVCIGKHVWVGTGAVIINGTPGAPIEIGEDAVIGAGACVIRSIPPGETWGGVPARKIK